MKKAQLVLMVLCMGFLLVMSGCKQDTDSTYTVRYEITGPSTTASEIKYFNGTGINMDYLYDVSIPWDKTITVSGSAKTGLSSGVLATFTNNDKNIYIGKIFVDGKEKASVNSKESFLTVTYTIRD